VNKVQHLEGAPTTPVEIISHGTGQM